MKEYIKRRETDFEHIRMQREIERERERERKKRKEREDLGEESGL